MRATRAALSIFVLVTIVIGTPIVARAHAYDRASDVVAFDDDPDVPAIVDVPSLEIVPVARPFVVVDLHAVGLNRKSDAVLPSAPKTSPPRRRS